MARTRTVTTARRAPGVEVCLPSIWGRYAGMEVENHVVGQTFSILHSGHKGKTTQHVGRIPLSCSDQAEVRCVLVNTSNIGVFIIPISSRVRPLYH